MSEYTLRTVTPRLVSEIKQKGKRTWFSVVAEDGEKMLCYSRFLRDAFEVGRKVEVSLTNGRFLVITGVTGFTAHYPEPQNEAPINKAEAELFKLMSQNGWELTKKGWPDFACIKDGKLILLEVKPKRSHRLKYWQRRLMMEMVKHDIKCYRWSPDGGFEPILEHVAFPVNLP